MANEYKITLTDSTVVTRVWKVDGVAKCYESQFGSYINTENGGYEFYPFSVISTIEVTP